MQPRFLSVTGQVLPGIRRVVIVPVPAAGAEWSINVPGGMQWRIPVIRWRFISSAAVASRFTNLNFTVEGTVIFEAVNISAITANQTVPFTAYNTAVSANSATVNASSTFPIPMLWLPEMSAIGSRTANIDVADQYSQISMYVEEVYDTNQQITEYYEGR